MVTLSSQNGLLILPSPLFDNTFSSDNQVKIKKSMTNRVYSYVKTSPFIILKYTFSLNRSQAIRLGQFYLDSANRHIYITDWLNQSFVGFITNDLSISENRAYDNHVELEFEGLQL